MQLQNGKFETIEDFLAAIGYGGVSLARIMPRIKEEYLRYVKPSEPEQPFMKPKKPKDTSGGVIVEGLDDCLVKFAKCCNPLPGDEIIGFVTRGYGVSVHKRDCVNVINSINDPEQKDRWVRTRWSDEVLKHSQKSYKATIRILAYHSPTLLADISNAIYNMHLPIETLNALKLDNDVSSVQITCTVQNLEQLKAVMNQFNKMPMVFQVERVYQ